MNEFHESGFGTIREKTRLTR